MESAFLKIINAKVLTPSGLLPNGQIIISDGKIVEITGQNREIPHAEIIDAKGYYVAPGCIDTHVHGGNGHDFTEATPKAFYAITRAHALQEQRLYILHWQLPYRYLPGSDQDLRAHHEPPGTGSPHHGITSRRQLFEYGYERRTRP